MTHTPPRNNLRRPSHLNRLLEHNHQEPVVAGTLFDEPDYQNEETPSREDHLDLFNFNNQEGYPAFNNQDQPAQPQSALPFKPQQPQPRPFNQPPPPQDSADWDTRATILLAEVVVVTIIVGTVLFCCLRKNHRRLIQQTFTAEQMQEWTTIRIPSAYGSGPQGSGQTVMVQRTRDGRTRVRVDSNMSGMVSIHSAAAAQRDTSRRMRVDSGISGMGGGSVVSVSVRSGTAADPQAAVVGSTSGSDRPEQTSSPANRTTLQRIRAVPRRIGNAVLAPLRMLEAGVNGWATENYDEVFLRQFMERLEMEREAARENPDDREVRLKEAFMKECMVWELGDEHFLPPKKLGDEENMKPSSSLYAEIAGDGTIKCIKEINVDDDENLSYGLYPMKANVDNDLYPVKSNKDYPQDLEEGNIKGTFMQDLPYQGEEKNDQFTEQSEGAVDTGGASATDQKNTSTSSESTSMEHQTSLPMDTVSSDTTTIQDQPTSPSSVLVSSTSAGTLHSSVPPAVMTTDVEDTFDEDEAPGYLYLNASGHNRRRANTGGTVSTNISSSGHSTLASSESMETMSSSADDSQSSHQIPNECAICLCAYEPGDTVVTSCNSECPHAFHQECIVEWLVKMQDGTPCPCCRRTFVELDEHIPAAAGGTSNNNNTNNNNNSANGNAAANTEENTEAERLRQESRRRHIEQGIRRGRAFNMNVISLRNNNGTSDTNARDPEEAARLRQVRARRNLELGLRRGGRAFNTSVISLR